MLCSRWRFFILLRRIWLPASSSPELSPESASDANDSGATRTGPGSPEAFTLSQNYGAFRPGAVHGNTLHTLFKSCKFFLLIDDSSGVGVGRREAVKSQCHGSLGAASKRRAEREQHSQETHSAPLTVTLSPVCHLRAAGGS